MTQIRQRAPDPEITPIPVFRRHANDQRLDLLSASLGDRGLRRTLPSYLSARVSWCHLSSVSGVTIVARAVQELDLIGKARKCGRFRREMVVFGNDAEDLGSVCRFVLMAVAGWMNQEQQHAIQYLREENRVLRAQLGNRRLHLTDDPAPRSGPPMPG